MKKMKNLIDRLRKENRLEQEGYLRLLKEMNEEHVQYLAATAREVAVEHFGKAIFARGLIEISNYCRNNCYYCGIRCANREVERYRLSTEQILTCCETGYRLGLKTFVLQAGEDSALTEEFVTELVATIRSRYPDHVITLSLGEYSEEAYQKFAAAGANRYLLRHETANATHYALLHPAQMSHQKRIDCLHALKKIGYETGAGFMVGSPGQTPEHLVEDLLFLQQLRPEMIGIGPFIPQKETPFATHQAGSVELTLKLLSILRLMFPDGLIPATTALATLAQGHERGILAGANVVMPNLTPDGYREKYAIYETTTQTLGFQRIEQQVKGIGYYLC